MENASKALIIAGAILLSILIIGIGVFIYNQAAGTIRKANLSTEEIQQYNSKFAEYEGTNVSGSQAKALCDLVKQHDLANQTDLSKQIMVTTTALTGGNYAATEFTSTQTSTATTVKAGIRPGYTYKITFSYDPRTGYITQIGITQN